YRRRLKPAGAMPLLPPPTKREQRLISGKGATVFLLKRFTFDPDRATTVPRLSSTSFEDPP
ncbi:hypothetical protein, partial [Pseudomonas aeruginosa]|uniref:hypothetical protein n=1 Tax=Pseudomonas aeruginosa TaxID=287 RepID=UPI001ABCA600